MYDTRITLLREAAIDRCLRDPKGRTFRDIMTEVSKYLASNNVDSSVSKTTTHRDMDSIKKRYNVEIDQVKDEETKKTLYRYRDPLFSIYNSKLKADDIAKIQSVIDIISQFAGFPQFEWVDEICAKLHASAYEDENRRQPIVSFSYNPSYSTFLRHFGPLFDSIKSKTAIDLFYRKFNCDEQTYHTVHPYHLKEFQHRWYLVGITERHPESLTCFALDRIVTFSPSVHPFIENPGFDIEEYFGAMVGITIPEGAVPQDVLLWVANRDYPYLETNPIHPSQKFVRVENDGKVISLHVILNYELEMRIFAYGERMKVMAPDDFREAMKTRIASLAKLYGVM